MHIKITNYCNKDILKFSLPLITGEVIAADDSKIFVQNLTHESKPIVWPVIKGKFKALVKLKKGVNEIKLTHKSSTLVKTFFYEPLNNKKFIRLVYIKCKDDEGTFQSPDSENNSVESACRRICLAGEMLQVFTFDKIKDHDLSGKTFRLEENNGQSVCHVFTSSLTLEEAYQLTDNQLWSHFAVELMTSSLRVNNDCKFLAFLSFTRYRNETGKRPENYKEVLSLTKGQVALGGGGLALFGTGCLHTWPESIQDVPLRFGDKRKIDPMKLMDDSANRGFFWACYSTGLGATLHELGHTFDLGHTFGGIMGRGFDDIHKYFIVDMFYYDSKFQLEYNPNYQEHSSHSHAISFANKSSSLSLPVIINAVQNINLHNLPEDTNEEFSFLKVDDEKPWERPNPPDFYSNPSFAVNVGKAYWTRSSALILYYHRWFNEVQSEGECTISETDCQLVLHSPNGIRVIEFRNESGTAFHHLEFTEKAESVHLADYNLLPVIPDGVKKVSFLVEDAAGQILKSNLF